MNRQDIADELLAHDLPLTLDEALRAADIMLSMQPERPHFHTPGCNEQNCPMEPLTASELAEMRQAIAGRFKQ